MDILLWVRPLLLGIPFPEALHPDSVRRARKLGHIRKLPQMPAPAEVPEAVNRKHPFNGGVPSVDLAIHHLGVHLPDGHQPCSSVRVIGLRTSSVDDVMRLRAVTLASPHSGTATIAVLQRQCLRGHPRPGSSGSALTCSLAAANSASGDGPASTSWPPGASLDSPGARTHTLARSPRPSRSISSSPRRIIRSRVEGRGSRTGEGVPPSVNYKLEMRRPLSNRRETAGKPPEDHWKTTGKTVGKTAGKPPGDHWQKLSENRRKPPGKAPFLGNFCQSQ